MDRADYNKFMMRVVARDLLASLIFRSIMQHTTPYNINKVGTAKFLSCSQVTKVSCVCGPGGAAVDAGLFCQLVSHHFSSGFSHHLNKLR